MWLSVFKLLESKKKQPKDTSAGAGTTTRSSTDSAEDLDSLLELQASFPCVGCDGKHRFTARLASKDQFVVICPKWRDSKRDDPDVQRLRKEEKGLIADLWRKPDPKQPKENAKDEKKPGEFYGPKWNSKALRKMMKAYVGTPGQLGKC